MSTLLLASACAPRAPSKPNADPSASSEARLELLEISPAAGSTLERSSTIVARLQFAVTPRAQQRYKASAKFQEVDGKTLFDGSFPNEAYFWIQNDQGTIELSFPMKYVYDEPRLGRPIRVCYVLARQLTSTTSRIVSQTEFVSYARGS
jgi:hypothetical protein